MKFIEVKDEKGIIIGEVRFDGKKIFPYSRIRKNFILLEDILKIISSSLPKDLSKAFNLIPERTAHYSRIFFGKVKGRDNGTEEKTF